MSKVKKGVRLDHISKIYQDPKTGKDFYAVKDTSLTIEPGSFVTLLGEYRLHLLQSPHTMAPAICRAARPSSLLKLRPPLIS